MTRALVSLSGGLDSTTVLASAIDQNRVESVEAVGFSYGSKHNPLENTAAKEIADWYGVPFSLIDISGVMTQFKSNLLESGDPIPEGHYEEESMRKTVVPGRNLIFISILMGLAQSKGHEEIWLGIHAGDHFIYEDCRPEFFHSANAAVIIGSASKVRLVAPFLHGDKTNIITEGRRLNVPYHLTRTCYTSEKIACSRCGSCQERLSAFAAVGIEDPLTYVSRELIQKKA